MQTICVVSLVLVLCSIASAYTIVMRGGRRIEVPSHFLLTPSTLTYEVSPGVQITINILAIDIPATEKVNKEAVGSFLRRVNTVSAEYRCSTLKESSLRPSNKSIRSITNHDLESSAIRRRDSELAYERRRQQLGLPSLEESRRQAAAESAVIAKDLEQTEARERASEEYWRGRASALRTEIAAVDAELKYVRGQLDETAFPTLNGSFATVITGGPFGPFGSFGSFGSLAGQFGRGAFGRPVVHGPGVFGPPRNGTQLTGRIGFGRAAGRGRVFPNPLGFPRSHPFHSPLLAPGISVFGSTLAYDDASYERNWLITRFNELAATRAGLNARWRELEDEARRAGAPPGWLRQ